MNKRWGIIVFWLLYAALMVGLIVLYVLLSNGG